MTSEGGNHKRPRIETGNGDSIARIRPRTWERILVASGVGFRVYRGLLAKRSEVFCDLFSVPQPRDSQLVFGCPVVHLSDTDVALRELLDVLMCGKRYILKNDVELDRLSYRIRLAHKYGIEDLLEESIRELKKLYPTTLSEWADLRRHYSPRAITAVNLARLTKTHTVWPSALYVCCQLDDHYLVDGTTHPDGTVERLDRDDLLRCITAKVDYTHLFTDAIHDLFLHLDSPSHKCYSKATCRLLFRCIRGEARSRSFAGMAGVLEPWDKLLDKYDRKKTSDIALASLCELCTTTLRAHTKSRITDTWADLPHDFGGDYDDWNEGGATSESDD
ncbi:uncharacterized protein B0H18DRAFT_987529 [Fomitopsis serialis]|uniref:uncharacterized protein n=1 Tax=Fomitopsis serialis TaxID=139415 RepID=UPI00200789C1|nr:uncharacterized protein B0H18DRAFT_987529 [Neoantrodia serialis]KAH9932310.1 hypothetical protein B0H18DRAFT_987529 [Neoantrodia serialis]